MVQGDFERLEETAGEKFLFTVDADFVQHLFLRYFLGLVKVLVNMPSGSSS